MNPSNKPSITELKNRQHKIQQQLIEKELEGCVISSSVNQFYMHHCIFDGFSYIPADGEPLLFVRRPVGVEALNGEVIYIRKPEQIPDLLCERKIALPQRIGIEMDSVSHNLAERLKKAWGEPRFFNISHLIRELRSLKSEYELEQMRQCASIQSDVYRRIPSLYREGMTDIEFQIEVEYLMRQKGSLGIFRAFGDKMDIFMGSVLAGDNARKPSPFDFSMGGKGLSAYLPIGASGVLLESGMTIMFDMAGNYGPYQSDLTRTFAIGKVNQKVSDAHRLSIEMNQWVQDTVKEGTSCSEIYNHSLKMVEKHHLEEHFMGIQQQAAFVGHGVGLEINEPPVLMARSKTLLQANMAFAYEPKFVFPGIGAVGVENTFIVTCEGALKITLCDERLIEL